MRDALASAFVAARRHEGFVLGEDPLRSHLPFWGFRADMVVPGELRATLEALCARDTEIGGQTAGASARPPPRKGRRRRREGMNNALGRRTS